MKAEAEQGNTVLRGLDGSLTAGSGLDAATAWLTPGDIDRRTFLAVSGMPLLQALWGASIQRGSSGSAPSSSAAASSTSRPVSSWTGPQ